MMARDEHGRFAKGNCGGPGRPRRNREQEYHEILVSVVTPDEWRQIVMKAVDQAKRGDNVARKWLADYLIGPPVERRELTGAEGEPIEFIEIVRYADRDSHTDNQAA